LASAANATHGRIGVAAVDLSTGKGISVMGDQPFPLASTGKVAIVATFLDGVDQGRFKLTDRFPMRGSRHGGLSASELIDMAIIHSNNGATDALLNAIGGPAAVDRWLKRLALAGCGSTAILPLWFAKTVR
jgi:beta-lactamase class A